MLDDDGELVSHPTTVLWANLISVEGSTVDPNGFHIPTVGVADLYLVAGSEVAGIKMRGQGGRHLVHLARSETVAL